MIYCKDCNIPMTGVTSFSKDKAERFNRCPKCHGETKHVRIKSNQLKFGEEVHK